MKTIVVSLIIAVISGLVIGASSAAFRALPGARTERATAVVATGSAKVEIDSEKFDFGVLDAAKEGSHDFVFTNKGSRPLTLTKGESSCRCTVGEIDKSELAPGESTNVRVKWRSKNIGGMFKQSVAIKTNDPDRREVILSITGTFSDVVSVNPSELDFGHIVGNEPVTREARILCNLPNRPLELAGFEFLKEDLAKYFDVKTRQMTIDELVEQKHIGSGVLVTVTAKPGLPPGRFVQRILLQTNLPDDAREKELDLVGSVGKEVSLVGNGWDDDIGVLTIGPIKAGVPVERVLFLIARGADAKKIGYNVVHVEPDFLKVKLGEPEVNNDGKLSRAKLTIEIPPRDAPVSYMDDDHGKAGEIEIDTTNSEIPKLKVRVRFAVDHTTGNDRN